LHPSYLYSFPTRRSSDLEPIYFKSLLATLLEIDYGRFESFTEVLSNSFRNSDMYIYWLGMINQMVLDEVDESSYEWKKLPTLYQDRKSTRLNSSHVSISY